MDASNEGNRNFFLVGVRFFAVKEGLCFSIPDFYDDAFENSRSIKYQLCRVLYEGGLSWKNVSAYGADNASVNYGISNSVYTKLQSEENNDIITGHCNDHILHNCAKYALRVMSFDVENVVMKVYAEYSPLLPKDVKISRSVSACYVQNSVKLSEVIRHVLTPINLANAKFIHRCWSNYYQLTTTKVVFPLTGFGWVSCLNLEHIVWPRTWNVA